MYKKPDSRKFYFTNGSELEVGTFYCVGKNYSEHIREMGDGETENPVIFIKPPSSYLPDGGRIILPKISQNVHYEVELIVVLGQDGNNIKKDECNKYIAGFAVGIDLTMRDIQSQAKKNGEPWAISKGFRTSAPVSKIIPFEEINDINKEFIIELYQNNELRQKASTNEMLRKVPDLIEFISSIFDLRCGDAIFTGTPSGVGKINSGDKLKAVLSNYIELNVEVT